LEVISWTLLNVLGFSGRLRGIVFAVWATIKIIPLYIYLTNIICFLKKLLINNNNNNTRTMFMVLISWLRVIAWVHPVHTMNAEQRQTTAGLWPAKPTHLSHWPACRRLWNCIHHRHLLLLSPKADIHFTIPQRL